ncbi:MBL fold metallo-hydrolase [Chloroflexota bacterium]
MSGEMLPNNEKDTHTVTEFNTDQGGRIFQIPLNAFPGFWVYAYLVLVDDYKVLIDTGSNFDASNQSLEDGLLEIGKRIGQPIGLTDLTHVLITHGHIDHFGGLAYIQPRTQAKVSIHELDRRNLCCFEERRHFSAHKITEFLNESGVSADKIEQMLQMYMFPMTLFSQADVDFTYEAAGMQVGPFKMLHVPGHCAGMVVIRLHDVLFSADHVLTGISPHQAPESLTLNTGLWHYLQSLQTVVDWAADVRLTLGSHKQPINDLSARVEEIRGEHIKRLSKIIDILEQPSTVADISRQLFGKVGGYNILLALEETGAHIEFLYQYGLLSINNLGEIQNGSQPVAIRYARMVDEFNPKFVYHG